MRIKMVKKKYILVKSNNDVEDIFIQNDESQNTYVFKGIYT